MKKFSQIKSFQTTTSQGRPKYVISADKFAKFESDLFDLLGIENTAFKPSPAPSSTIESQQLNCDTIRSKLVPDITHLESSLDLNPMGQIQLLKRTSGTKEKEAATIIENEHEMRSKVITVILNQQTTSSTTTSSRPPRKSGRILLTKKNSTSLDSVLSEIGNIFKAVESLPIRRLFNLRGTQVMLFFCININ